MEIIPWRPFGGELSSLRREMDDLWNRFFGERPLARRLTEEWWPSVDVSETKDTFVIKAELPGMDAKDVSVTISGNVLTVKGEKKGGGRKGRAPLPIRAILRLVPAFILAPHQCEG